MKRILLIICLVIFVKAVMAQSVIGKWYHIEKQTSTEEQIYYYTFEANGQAELKLLVRSQVPNNRVGYIVTTVTIPGLYIVESGKALTVTFDKSKCSVNMEFEPSEEFATILKNKTDGAEELNAIMKKSTADQLASGAGERIKSMTTAQLPMSYLFQISYSKGGSLVLQEPVRPDFERRKELSRVE